MSKPIRELWKDAFMDVTLNKRYGHKPGNETDCVIAIWEAMKRMYPMVDFGPDGGANHKRAMLNGYGIGSFENLEVYVDMGVAVHAPMRDLVNAGATVILFQTWGPVNHMYSYIVEEGRILHATPKDGEHWYAEEAPLTRLDAADDWAAILLLPPSTLE